MIDLKKYVSRYSDKLIVLGSVKNIEIVSTDSRTMGKGDFYLPLVGDKFDGHNYISRAIEMGCIGFVFNKSKFSEFNKVFENYSSETPLFAIGVENTEVFLQELSIFHHRSWKEKNKDTLTIAITGSNGKTTTKEMLYKILDSIFPNKILSTQGNFNNHIGLPKTLLRLRDTHKVAVTEIGTNHPGEIEFLCKIGEPDAGIITNIGQSHLEFFISEENVFKEKRALFDYIRANEGHFVYDSDDEYLGLLANVKSDVIHSVGFNSGKTTLNLRDDHLKFKGELNFEVNNTSIAGEHNFKNLAIAASLCSFLFPAEVENIKEYCCKINFQTENRSQEILKDGRLYFLDAYNANPSSMKAALKGFRDLLKSKDENFLEALFVLGDMNELGESSPRFHEEIGKFLNDLNIVNAIFVGQFARDYEKGFAKECRVFDEVEELKSDWHQLVSESKNVFLKASRSLQLEKLMSL